MSSIEMDSQRKAAPDKLYYLANFHTLASYVTASYEDLLDMPEKQWYDNICEATIPAQCLYVRLLMRRKSLFRMSKLEYAEIGLLDDAMDELASRQLIKHEISANFDDLAQLFTVPELRELIPTQRGVSTLPRVELLERFNKLDDPAIQGIIEQLNQGDSFISVSGHGHWSLLQLCFFGNLYQDSSELILEQLGMTRYESYDIRPSARAFGSRRQINAHLKYFECEALFDSVDTKQPEQILALLAQLPEPLQNDRTLARRLDRFRNRMARLLEKLGEIDAALQQYARSECPPARERRVRILMATNSLENADALCKEMLESPYNEQEWQVAQRLNRQCILAQGKKPLPIQRFKPQKSRLVLQESEDSVERAVEQFYKRNGDCFYVENALFNGVFGLFIWDIIFAPVAGAFYNPFQSAPADFHYPSFKSSRQELLQERFMLLEDSTAFKRQVLDAYELHHGKVNPLANWKRLSNSLLVVAIERIPMPHWRAIFERLLLDIRENSNGFPDLVRFPVDGGYELVEVKGPGDQLQANQRRWMQFFSKNSIPYRLVQVSWSRAHCV